MFIFIKEVYDKTLGFLITFTSMFVDKNHTTLYSDKIYLLVLTNINTWTKKPEVWWFPWLLKWAVPKL
jgi:hypothetical protein